MIRLAIGMTVSLLVLLTAWAAASTLEVDGGAADYFRVEIDHPPAQVQGLSADVEGELTAVGRFSAVLQGAVQVTWVENDEDEGVSEYRVYRSDGYDGQFAQIGAAGGASYTDHAVEEGETYVYYVTAVNEVGESVPSDEASAEIPVDCEALEGSEDYDAAVADGDCPELTPTPTPTAEPTGEALGGEVLGVESAVEATPTPLVPTPTGTPFTNPTPGTPPSGTPAATQTPIPTLAPSTATPEPSPTSPPPTQTPEPSPTQEPTAEPTAPAEPTDTPDPDPTVEPTP